MLNCCIGKVFFFKCIFLPLTGLQVKETEDNEAVVSTVIDLHKLIKTKHLPAVHGWVQVQTHGAQICRHGIGYYIKEDHWNFCVVLEAWKFMLVDPISKLELATVALY